MTLWPLLPSSRSAHLPLLPSIPPQANLEAPGLWGTINYDSRQDLHYPPKQRRKPARTSRGLDHGPGHGLARNSKPPGSQTERDIRLGMRTSTAPFPKLAPGASRALAHAPRTAGPAMVPGAGTGGAGAAAGGAGETGRGPLGVGRSYVTSPSLARSLERRCAFVYMCSYMCMRTHPRGLTAYARQTHPLTKHLNIL